MRRSWRGIQPVFRGRRVASGRNACASMAGEGHRDRDDFEREIPNFERGYPSSAVEEQGGGNPSSGGEEQLPASMAGEREESNSGPYVPYYNGGPNPYPLMFGSIETYICPEPYVGPRPTVGPIETYICPGMAAVELMLGPLETYICPYISTDPGPSPNVGPLETYRCPVMSGDLEPYPMFGSVEPSYTYPVMSTNFGPSPIGGSPLAASSSHPVESGASASRSEEFVIKVLCPSDKIDLVIGEVDRIREETGTQIEVADAPVGPGREHIITIISTESLDDTKSMAAEAVLLLERKINDGKNGNGILRLLIPSQLIRFIIATPEWAGGNDGLVKIFGPVKNVRNSVVQLISRIRYRNLGNESKEEDGQ